MLKIKNITKIMACLYLSCSTFYGSTNQQQGNRAVRFGLSFFPGVQNTVNAAANVLNQVQHSIAPYVTEETVRHNLEQRLVCVWRYLEQCCQVGYFEGIKNLLYLLPQQDLLTLLTYQDEEGNTLLHILLLNPHSWVDWIQSVVAIANSLFQNGINIANVKNNNRESVGDVFSRIAYPHYGKIISDLLQCLGFRCEDKWRRLRVRDISNVDRLNGIESSRYQVLQEHLLILSYKPIPTAPSVIPSDSRWNQPDYKSLFEAVNLGNFSQFQNTLGRLRNRGIDVKALLTEKLNDRWDSLTTINAYQAPNTFGSALIGVYILSNICVNQVFEYNQFAQECENAASWDEQARVVQQRGQNGSTRTRLVNHQWKTGETPFYLAVGNNKWDLALLYLYKGVNPSLPLITPSGVSNRSPVTDFREFFDYKSNFVKTIAQADPDQKQAKFTKTIQKLFGVVEIYDFMKFFTGIGSNKVETEGWSKNKQLAYEIARVICPEKFEEPPNAVLDEIKEHKEAIMLTSASLVLGYYLGKRFR